ncbi:MAG: hypothetical protein NTV92_09050 [Candidatus Bipolaricaulota bacterium]|nr:hypothetical protein [Candidatus Bipolaricaulota bacterium]
MVFAKLWLLGILVAVLSVAALPPSSAPIIVNNQVPAQEQAASVPVVQPCPDTTTAQVAAAEERLSGLIERNRQELQTETAQAAASATELDGRLLQIEERLRFAENQVVERKADVQAMRGAMVAPLIMTWVLTGLAAVVAMAAGYGALRARHAKRESRDTTTKP